MSMIRCAAATLVVLASLARLPLPALAQTSISVTLDAVDASRFPAMTARATVTDEDGLPLRGLAAASFELVEDGRASLAPDSVHEVSDDAAAVSVLLLIDLGSTMRGEPLQAAKAACASFIAALLNQPDDQDRAAFIGITAQVNAASTDMADEAREVPFTNDAGRLLNVINFVEAERSGGTPLYDSVYRAVRIASQQPGRRAIIVMTDGRDVGSMLKDDDAVSEAKQQHVPVFTIGLSNSNLDSAFLTRLAELTGGSYQEAPSTDELSQKFTEVLSDLKVQYQLDYTSTLTERDGQDHSLLVRVRAGPAQAFDEMRYPLPGDESPAPTAEEPTAAAPSAGATVAATTASGPGEATPSPAAAAPGQLATPETAESEGYMQSVTDVLADNPILIVILAAALFLFLLLVVLVIWFVRRRSRSKADQSAYQQQPYFSPPEPPAFPRPSGGPKSEFETSNGGHTAATGLGSFSERSPGFGSFAERASGTETEAAPSSFDAPWPPSPFRQDRPGSETQVEAGPPPRSAPFGQVPLSPTPFGSVPPAADPFAQAPPAGAPFVTPQPSTPPPASPTDDGEATVVMQRAPHVALLGLLINRRQPSERYDVDKPTVSIGRAKGNVIVLDNPTVSRQHATMKLEGDRYVVYDLGSANGTFVGDERVREPVAIEDGMVVRFGELEFTYKLMSLQ